jgi:hypothetical protein
MPDRYLLLDHFFCVCGRRMTTKTLAPDGKTLPPEARKHYYYYRCPTKSYPSYKDTCRELQVRSKMADTIVWTWLEMLLGMDEDLLRNGLNKLATERDSESQSKQASIDAANAKIEAIGKKITNLMRTFEDDDDEDVVAGLRMRINELKKAKAELVSYRDKVAAEVSSKTISPSQIDDVITFSREIKKEDDKRNL